MANKEIFSMEAEQSVIQACVVDYERVHEFSFLNPEDFYYKVHREVFSLVLDLNERGEFFDATVIGNYFGDEWGGIAYFVDLMRVNISLVNAVAYGRIVLDLSIRRSAISEYLKTIDNLSDTRESCVKYIGESEEVINKQIARLTSGDNLSVDQLIEYSLNAMENSQDEICRGVSTGIPEIDARLGYRLMACGEITALGALSKNGKTLFANTIIGRMELKENETSLIFSIEMPEVGMFNSIISGMTGVPSNFYDRQAFYLQKYPDMYNAWMGRWGEAAQKVRADGKIDIDGKKDVDMNYIISQIRKKHEIQKLKGKKLRVVVIDHYHRINFDTSKKTMTYVMGDDARKLKNVAAELDISILLLTQLKEDCKDRQPTAYDILDTSRLRHEIQCFIGLKMYRQDGSTYFGISCDAHRYGDTETVFDTGYVKLIGGVVKSMPEGEYFNPKQQEQ